MIDPSKNIPTVNSKSEVWIQWHKDLKKVFNKKIANSVFLFAWDKRGGINSPANNSMLNKYVESQGFDLTRDRISQATEDILDFVGGVGSMFFWITIISLGVGGIIVILIIKKILENPELVNLATPQGRAISMIK
jgi:hypothetical protein